MVILYYKIFISLHIVASSLKKLSSTNPRRMLKVSIESMLFKRQYGHNSSALADSATSAASSLPHAGTRRPSRSSSRFGNAVPFALLPRNRTSEGFPVPD